MAKHLYIGNDTAVARTVAGILDNGAIEIQKLSASGPTAMVAGDTIADSAQFRIVQGNGTRDLVSPWIYGKDVIDWSGKSHVAQVAESRTVQITGAATNTADVVTTIKFINKTNGAEPFNMKSYNVTTNAAVLNTAAEIGEAYVDQLDATYNSGGGAVTTTQSDQLPDFIKTYAWDNTDLLTFVGWKKGEIDRQGNVVEHPTTFEIVTENLSLASNGGVATLALVAAANRGYGDAFYVAEMEENHKAIQYGYHNRIHLPKTPANTTVAGTTYDMYHIAATKDGSSSSQINGVDNVIEINIAFDNTTAGLTGALESVLNGYLGSVGYAPVNL